MDADLAAGRNWSVETSVMTKKEERLLRQQEKLQAECARLEGMKTYEREYRRYGVLCGIDEAGRGPLAGPVVAGAVILPADCEILYLNDSKKLTARRRELLYDDTSAADTRMIQDSSGSLRITRWAFASSHKSVNFMMRRSRKHDRPCPRSHRDNRCRQQKKRAQRQPPWYRSWEPLARQLSCAPVSPTRRNGQGITRTDNHYTMPNNLREEGPKLVPRYKELFTSL